MMFDEQMVNAVKVERRMEMEQALRGGPLGPVDPSWRKARAALARLVARRPRVVAPTPRRRPEIVAATQES